MKSFVVHWFSRIIFVLALAALSGGVARAESTFHLTDNTTVVGEPVTIDDRGMIVKKTDGTYTDHIPWGKISQDDLRVLQQNPKAAAFVDPFIEITSDEKKKRTEITVTEVAHPQRPAKAGLIGSMFGSGIGMFMILVMYAGNIYAAYEIAVYRGRPVGLVCGVSAVAPLAGPLIFLAMAPAHQLPQNQKAPEEWAPPAEEYQDTAVAEAAAADQAANPGEPAAAAPAGGLHMAAAPAAAAHSPAKSYLRGQYTFNRRFFETQMPSFFGVVRSGPDKDMVLSIRSARGTYVGQRISRISANDLNLQVQKGNASEDVVIPFTEIQEVQLKPMNA